MVEYSVEIGVQALRYFWYRIGMSLTEEQSRYVWERMDSDQRWLIMDWYQERMRKQREER